MPAPGLKSEVIHKKCESPRCFDTCVPAASALGAECFVRCYPLPEHQDRWDEEGKEQDGAQGELRCGHTGQRFMVMNLGFMPVASLSTLGMVSFDIRATGFRAT